MSVADDPSYPSRASASPTYRGYPLKIENWTLAGRRFSMAWPSDMDEILDDPRTQARYDADGYMPYWAQPWPGAILLAEAVLKGEPGAGRRAIELGCGIGLVSLAAAQVGWAVTASDYDEDAVAFTAFNAERVGVRLAGTAVVDFRRPPAEPGWDAVFASDLLYERRNSEPLAHWVAAALRPGGFAWFSDPHRTAADGFPDAAAACELLVRIIDVETRGPAGQYFKGRIFELRAPDSATPLH